jgi:hypothetical protein
MMSKQQKNPADISDLLVVFFNFLEASGIRWRIIEQGDDAGMWLPLASTLRKCRYAGRDSAALDRSNIKRMLIDGRVQAAVEVNDFALYFARLCQEPAARDLGVEVLDTFVAPIYKTGRPDIATEPAGVDTIRRHLEAKGFDLHTGKGIADAFLALHPEWADDVEELPEGGRTMTAQFCLATLRFLYELSADDDDDYVRKQEVLVQYILDNCNGEFGPASTRKKSRKRSK